jgi:hypothetical protein
MQSAPSSDRKEETAMKTGQTTLRSFERIARSRGLSTLLVGGLLVIFVLGGHGALYDAFRFAASGLTAAPVEA